MQQPPPLKRLFFDRIFHRSYWTWRKHPVIIVPSMLNTGLSTIRQAAITLPILIYLTLLATNKNLTQFLNEYYAPGTGYLGGIPMLLRDPLFSPGLTLVIGSIGVAVVLIAILGGGFVLSAEYGTYMEAWAKNSVPIGSVLENGRRNWKRAAWTLLLTDIVSWGPAAIGIGLFFLQATDIDTGVTSSDFSVILPYGLLAATLIVVSLVTLLLSTFSIPIAIVDQTSGLKAIGKSFRFVVHNFRVTLTYVLVRISFLALYITLFFFEALVGQALLSLLGAVLVSLLVTPILHNTKVMIYSYGRPTESEMPFELFDPIWRDVARGLPRAGWRKIRVGLSEIVRFLSSPGNLPFHALAILSFIVGTLLGEYVSTNGLLGFLDLHPGTINPAVAQSFGPVLGISIFVNNWIVSIGAALSGIGFGLPSFQTILYNGFNVGTIIPAFQNLTLLLALILPHGIIEIPSIILSGSIGLKLGWGAIKAKAMPSPDNSAALSSTLRQTVYIVVGLALLFIIAGTIEANLTPIIMRWFGWTG